MEKVKLTEVCKLQAHCEGIVLLKSLGFKADTGLSKLGEEAKKFIEYEAGKEIKSLEQIRAELMIKHQLAVVGESPESISEEQGAEINKLINADPDTAEWNESSEELWGKEVEFEATPIKISIPDNCEELFTKKLDGKPLMHEANGLRFVIDPYFALLEMVKKGFIIIE